MTKSPWRILLAALLVAACVHQTTVTTTYAPVAPPAPNELSVVEKALGWRLLFDGHSLVGWHGVGFTGIPAGHWTIDAGTVRRLPHVATPPSDAKTIAEIDLASDSSYQDFELTWEWKISVAGNSGLKYNVSDSLSATVSPPNSAKGWEYQMNDDEKNDDNKLASHRSGALYDIVAPNEKKQLNPAGQWNQSAILRRGNHAEHWLNGEEILAYDLGTPAFDSALARSKFVKYPAWFAVRRAGEIVLQDHGDVVWFRSIKIRAIK